MSPKYVSLVYSLRPGGLHQGAQVRHTRARASKPKLCPSTVSMRWFLANLRLPSMTKATCCGIGPCRRAPIRSSRSWVIPHSTGGDWRSHFRICERCMDGMAVAEAGRSERCYSSTGLSAGPFSRLEEQRTRPCV